MRLIFGLNKKNSILVVSIVLLFAVIGSLIYLHTVRNVETEVLNNKPKYDAESKIKMALERLKGDSGSVNLITDIETVDKKLALTFDGFTDTETINKILAVLDKYDIKATFFIPGIQGAEDDNTVQAIAKAEQEIGNYSLSGKKHMEKLTEEEIIKDLCHTNVILGKITGKEPEILKCNVTEYTEQFLRAVGACGIRTVVDNDHFLSFQSFSSYDMANEYVNGLDRGSIISIKMEGALDEIEYEGKIANADPAIDKQPGIKGKVENVKTEVQILQIVEWLAQAISESNYATAYVKDFLAYQDTDYNIDHEAARIANAGVLSKVFKNAEIDSKQIGFTFRGVEDGNALETILEFLKVNNVKATFFVTGNEATDHPDRIKKILSEGHNIGNGGLTGNKLIDTDFSNVYFEIWKCGQILKENFGIATDIFMPAQGKYDNTIREAANALGYLTVTYNKNPVLDKESTIEQIMKYFNKGFKPGDVVYFQLNYRQDIGDVVAKTYKNMKKDGYGAIDIKTLVQKESIYKNERLAEIKKAADSKKWAEPSDYKKLRSENRGKKAVVVSKLYTAQPAVVYSLRGISDRKVLDEVLDVLDKLDAKASFFVTGKEVLSFPENVQEIISRGHQIYNGGYGMNTTNPSKLDFDSLCYEIEMGEKCLRNFLGEAYQEEVNSYYMPLYADTNGNVLEAASALGYKEVVTYNRNTMIDMYKNLSTDKIVANYFSNINSLHRGDIVYFRLDYLNQKGEIAKLVETIAASYIKPSTYDIALLNNMINDEMVYRPVPRTKAIGSNLIKTTYGYPENSLLNSVLNHFIGSQYINTEHELNGFTKEEIAKIDKSGKIDTKGEKVLFLTFDDWGSDKAITPLLNVLEKHNVDATFFVRVGNKNMALQDAMSNPNLLRAIAVAGHDIGNHTFEHMKINILTDDEEALLRADLVAAHQEMARYIGDTKALKLFFRPPTLILSKLGLETVFDCGFQYIINGDFSTHDYEAESKEQLIDKLKNGIGSYKVSEGSIIIMHMSDDSKYTADALDVVIPYYQAQGYRFAKLSEYLK